LLKDSAIFLRMRISSGFIRLTSIYSFVWSISKFVLTYRNYFFTWLNQSYWTNTQSDNSIKLQNCSKYKYVFFFFKISSEKFAFSNTPNIIAKLQVGYKSWQGFASPASKNLHFRTSSSIFWSALASFAPNLLPQRHYVLFIISL